MRRRQGANGKDFVSVRVRQRAQQNMLDGAEHDDVGSDAEGQGKRDDEREQLVVSQAAQGDEEVVPG